MATKIIRAGLLGRSILREPFDENTKKTSERVNICTLRCVIVIPRHCPATFCSNLRLPYVLRKRTHANARIDLAEPRQSGSATYHESDLVSGVDVRITSAAVTTETKQGHYHRGEANFTSDAINTSNSSLIYYIYLDYY